MDLFGRPPFEGDEQQQLTMKLEVHTIEKLPTLIQNQILGDANNGLHPPDTMDIHDALSRLGEALPEGWSADWSEEHDRHYYVNAITGEAQWDAPTASAASINAASASDTVLSTAAPAAEAAVSALSSAKESVASAGEATLHTSVHSEKRASLT